MKKSALKGVLSSLGSGRQGQKGATGQLDTLVDKLNQDWKVQGYED